MIPNYTFLNMAIAAYGVNSAGDDWGKAIGQFLSGPDPTTYLTLTNGYVSFILEAKDATAVDGHKYFAIVVYSGSYYCVDNDTENGSLSPQFFLEVRQA